MTVQFLKNGNIDLNTVEGRMYFCFAEDEYPSIWKAHPEFDREQLQAECLRRWYVLVENHEKYVKFLEVATV
jgi:hypothetical protein